MKLNEMSIAVYSTNSKVAGKWYKFEGLLFNKKDATQQRAVKFFSELNCDRGDKTIARNTYLCEQFSAHGGAWKALWRLWTGKRDSSLSRDVFYDQSRRCANLRLRTFPFSRPYTSLFFSFLASTGENILCVAYASLHCPYCILFYNLI